MAKKVLISQTRYVDPKKVDTHAPAGTTKIHVGTKDAHWTCNSCGQVEIDGNVKICPSCGNPKDSSETYEPSPDSHPYLTQKELNSRGVDMDHGSDEECPYCSAKIAPKSEVCPNCGGTIKDVGKTQRVCPSCSRETNSLICGNCGEKTVFKTTPTTHSSDQPTSIKFPIISNYSVSTIENKPNNKSLFLKIGAGFIILVVVIYALIAIFSPKEKTGVVVSNSWSCSIPLVEYQYNQHEDWSIPTGGDYISESEEIHHYDSVYDYTNPNCQDIWEVVGSHNENVTQQVCKNVPVYVDSTKDCYDDGTCDYTDIYEDELVCENVTSLMPVDDYGWVEHCNPIIVNKDVPVKQAYYVYKIWEWVPIQPSVSSGTDNTIICPVIQETETIIQSSGPTITCQTNILVDEKQRTIKPDCSAVFPYLVTGSEWKVTMSGPIIQKIEALQ